MEFKGTKKFIQIPINDSHIGQRLICINKKGYIARGIVHHSKLENASF